MAGQRACRRRCHQEVGEADVIPFLKIVWAFLSGPIGGFLSRHATTIAVAFGVRKMTKDADRAKAADATLHGIDQARRAEAEAADALATGMTPQAVKRRNDKAWSK
jgi:hypothetical protein